MPGSATTYTQSGVLGHTLGFAPMTMPTGVFVGLCAATQPPSAATGGAEVAGDGYARQPAVFADTATPNIAANTATLAFGPAAAPWGAIGFFEIWSALTSGTRLYWGPLVDPVDGITPLTRNVLAGDIVRFSAGVIQVRAT